MTSKRLLIPILSMTFYILTINNSWALKCKNLSTSEAFHESLGVFIGEVLTVEELTNNSKKAIKLKHIVTFSIHRSWKGSLPQITKITTEEIDGMWQNPFKVGETYLTFVHTKKDYAGYIFPICGVMKAFSDYSLIHELDELAEKGA